MLGFRQIWLWTVQTLNFDMLLFKFCNTIIPPKNPQMHCEKALFTFQTTYFSFPKKNNFLVIVLSYYL